MVYSEGEIKEIEEELTRYFRRKTEINRLKNKVDFLEKRRTRILRDIENSNIKLTVVIPSFSFDSEPIKSSNPMNSQQEKALESAFTKLEKQLECIEGEIMDIDTEIQDLEYQNCDIDFVLDKLESFEKEFIYLRYEKKIGYTKMADLLNSSVATISRLRLKILGVMRDYDFNMKRNWKEHEKKLKRNWKEYEKKLKRNWKEYEKNMIRKTKIIC